MHETWNDRTTDSLQAYETLYHEYFKKLYNYGHKFTTDTASIEDSIQELFLEVWKKRGSAASIQLPHSYFFAAFRYILLKKIKQRRRFFYTGTPEDILFETGPLTIAAGVDAATQQRLQAALGKLTARQREAIFLRFYEGLSYEDVAGIMAISVKATYKIMARSLAVLRETLSLSLATLLLLLRLPRA